MLYVPKKFEEEEERLMEEFFSVEDREESVDEFLDAHMSDDCKAWSEMIDKYRKEMWAQGIAI